MKRKVVWSETALEEVKNQVRYILRHNKDAAIKIARILRQSGEQIGERPFGRRGRRQGTYERVLPGLPYIMVFSLEAHTVTILHIFHGAQDWQNVMDAFDFEEF